MFEKDIPNRKWSEKRLKLQGKKKVHNLNNEIKILIFLEN
ncbi:unnamed protein product [Nezara viridula]|uniref:Uncharacterized protein n=1 Tax=Nezara viridula TaxID=85310 RepID=A0A9P0H7J2_NEZVI|nr:unnamed protein product [Nezara viridula]